MRAVFECIPCILRQVIEASRMATDDQDLVKEILFYSFDYLKNKDFKTLTPVEISSPLHRFIREKTKCPDPYLKIKEENNLKAAKICEKIRCENLISALKLAGIGNIFDTAPGTKYKHPNFEEEFFIFQFEEFKEALSKAKEILYLGDNAGEIFFDKFLVNELANYGRVTYVVRGGPAMDDALMEDAKISGIDKIAEIITTGVDLVGCVPNLSSPEFQKKLKEAELVISKGQGNFEGLEELKFPKIFFLLRAKCKVVADYLEVPQGSLIFKRAS